MGDRPAEGEQDGTILFVVVSLAAVGLVFLLGNLVCALMDLFCPGWSSDDR